MKPYPDTNLLTRVYLDLPGSEDADALLALVRDGKTEPLPITWLHRIEVTNAFELCVFLGRQSGHPRVAPETAAIALATFREDLASASFLRPVEIPDAALEQQFEELCLRHTSRHGFRAYDLLHVASAILLGCDTFWSFDERALRLSRLEGLGVSVAGTRLRPEL